MGGALWIIGGIVLTSAILVRAWIVSEGSRCYECGCPFENHGQFCNTPGCCCQASRDELELERGAQ